MEIEVKFTVNGREDLIRALEVLRGMGYDFVPEGKVRYSDTYYDPGDGGALRFREYEGGKIVRTYKRDKRVSSGVVYRVENEREVSREEMLRETRGRTPMLQTLTVRERCRSGKVELTYDVVWYDDSTQMAFIEVEGPEDEVRRIAEALKGMGFRPETRSKLEIGLGMRRRV